MDLRLFGKSISLQGVVTKKSDRMSKNLVIVESPAKAKTIEKYLGDDFIVTSSYGHVRDLPKSNAIDIDNQYKPNYEVTAEKKKVVTELKKLAKKAQEIYLATDEDREGEAISWHLCDVLGLDPATAKRITYTEVTPKAIQRAMENPRHIDQNLVNAQQARRILDRLVGFELSPVLWRKVKPSLSAGRVQSVAVKLLVEREREIQNFKPTSSFKLHGYFNVEAKDGRKTILKSEGDKAFDSEQDANVFLESCIGKEFKITSIEKKPSKRNPAAPFTTSTLQQEASRKLGFPVAKTMMVAQKLYEAGLITYMRTDSTTLSQDAINSLGNEIDKRYGDKYHQSRQFSTKSDSAQEAHEAIRPSYADRDSAGSNADEKRLYDLIWKRSIASQMSQAQIERTLVDIKADGLERYFKAKGEVLVFDGFLKVYQESSDMEDEEQDKEEQGMLPPLSVDQIMDVNRITATQRFTRPPARFTEASLVKKLEELGIGRPSTYAPTISTIQKRNYVLKDYREGVERKYIVLQMNSSNVDRVEETEITGAEKAKLFPTDIGMVVNDFLEKNFPNIMDYGFTAQIEKDFDEIAQGEIAWNEMIDEFYKPFHENVDKTIEHAERATGERVLGVHPESGEEVLARIGRYGPMVQVGRPDEEGEKKPRFAKLRTDQNISTITLEEALELFKLPRTIGQFDDDDVIANIGRFGPYILHQKKFTSIPKDMSPYTIKLDEAIELIEAKRKADAERLIADFPDEGIQILKGRWGPFIKKGKENYKIPKGTEATDLDLEAVLKIIEEAPEKKPRRRSRK